MRQIDAAVGRVRPLVLIAENVEVVATDAAQHFWPHALDLSAMFGGKRLAKFADLLCASAR